MTTKTIGEQIADLEAMRASKAADMEAVTNKAIIEGRTKDASEREQFDELKAEVKAIDAELADLRDMESINKAAAKPVEKSPSAPGVSTTRRDFATVKSAQNLEPGIAFARLARVKALAKLDGESIRTVAREQYGEDSAVFAVVNKAAVPAGATLEGNWAEWMLGEEGRVFGDFLEFLRPRTILGRFGNNGIPALRSIPAGVPIGAQTSGGEGYWVGEGRAKPLTRFDGEVSKLDLLKVANIAVVTEELLRKSTLGAERFLRDQLVAALASRLDRDFVDPAKAAAAGISPASITNGVTPLASSGGTADNIRTDIKTIFGSFIAAQNAPTAGVWLMGSTAALNVSMMNNPLGQPEFSGLSMTGGTFAGLPVIVSDYVAPGFVALVNASDIYVTEEGGVQVDMSREASLEMADNPAHNSTTPTGASLVSLWQTNSVGFRAERFINWARRRPSAVAYITTAPWAGYETP